MSDRRGGDGSSVDVAVVGGGVIGLASAWRLAQRGASVAVFDPAPGSGASGVAAGMIAPVTEARLGEESLLALNMASWALWPDFAADVEAATGGRPVGFRRDGTLMVALDADDRSVLDDLAARHRAMGLAVEPMRGRQARGLEPGLAPGVRGGLLAADERSVDPQAMTEALGAAATAAGATVHRERVERVVTTPDGGRITGVVVVQGDDLADGAATAGAADAGRTVEAGTVVLAAGCRSHDIAGLPDHVRPPVRPVKGQIVTLRQPPRDPLVTRTVRGIVRGSSIYLVPRDDGRVIVGATVEERGWDTAATAGGAYELLRDALALVPGLDDAELVAVRVGLRPGSPDDLPMVGPSGVDGLVVATGHHRNGILLTPVTADAVAAAVTGEPLPPEVAACDPRRFAVGLSGEAGRERRASVPGAGARA